MSARYTDVSLQLSWQLTRASVRRSLSWPFFCVVTVNFVLKGRRWRRWWRGVASRNRFMAACEQISSQTILHVKTGIHTLPSTCRLFVMFRHLFVFRFSRLHGSSARWHEVNAHKKKSERDFLWGGRRISHTRVRNLNVSDCRWAQGYGVFK